MSISIKKSEEFSVWFEGQPAKSQAQIDKRLMNIAQHGHFGDVKVIDEIAELRWDNGRRVYFGRIGNDVILLLNGGNKNGQSKDIKKAKAIFAQLTSG